MWVFARKLKGGWDGGGQDGLPEPAVHMFDYGTFATISMSIIGARYLKARRLPGT